MNLTVARLMSSDEAVYNGIPNSLINRLYFSANRDFRNEFHNLALNNFKFNNTR